MLLVKPSVKVPTAAQMADILIKGLQLPLVLACVNYVLHQRPTTSTKQTTVLNRGWVAKASKSSYVCP